ncbi:TraR/DksA family transcriptional regulator [Fimbriiglobus ruber]|uniref:DnaK suppressor protein n=1 Tax=Fimbriiglobus ruber TaxID=1908690 RepID=A0A225DTT9_9BACT|nr:TraR/DksA C4-type zinc finger protein [Fimbriiglobus ruber]OWK39795.1 DnaK suppressor protein [Fimbriiglobus ruber]
MTKTELEPVRNLLLQLQRRLRGDVDRLTTEVSCGTEMQSGGNLSNVPVEDRAERGSDSSDEDVTIGLMELESARLGEITAALDRIAGGTFGRCEGCARAIPSDRLSALPFTRLCIACARLEH